MKIERIPTFLSSPDDTSDFFAFDINGRYIICRRSEIGEAIFVIYDILFNEYIELTADIPSPNIVTQYRFENESSIWLYIKYFLPISTEKMLAVIQSGETCALLLLIEFDFKERKYKILDYVNILKCHKVEFVWDGDNFGLFFISSIDDEMVSLVDNENSFFALQYFNIQDNRIILDATRKRFNYKPYADFTHPTDLYLRNNKLWYIRRNDQDIAYLPNILHVTPSPQPPQNPNLRICYFNLEETIPTEVFVNEIQFEDPEKTYLLMQWIQDSLLFLHSGTKFNVLNLLNLEWKSEALDCGMDLTSLDINGDWQLNERWTEFQYSKNPDAYWANYSTIHISNEFVITAINRKSSVLYQIPLKEPLKLSLLAWTCAMNAGLIKENTKLPPKLPYSRLF